MSKEKVILAYSGGLDTSVCVKWLQDEKNLDVVCVCGNVGQEETGLDENTAKRVAAGFGGGTQQCTLNFGPKNSKMKLYVS